MNPSADRLEITSSQVGGATIVRIVGEVDMRTSPTLRTAILDVSRSKPSRIVIDLEMVQYMDSSGVGTMVSLKREIERLGGKLMLAGLQPRVRGVFEITQLDRFFVIRATVEEALGP
jgi:anti-sigma B factor antagonist